MPWSNGVYTRSNGVFTGATVWASDASVGTNITTSHHDTHDQDIATGLNNCVTVDGLNQIAANFVSTADGAYNLGAASFRWGNAYFSGTIAGGTFTGSTLSSPVLSGTATGTYTLAGTPTLTSPTINTPTINTPTINTPTINTPTINTPTITGTYALGGAPTLPAIIGDARNLRFVWNSATVAFFSADEVIVKTALGGTVYNPANISLTLNLANTGANGMDTGSPPTGADLSVYLIYNPTTPAVALLACAGATSNGSVYSGANMPSGYTASALVSSLRTNGSAQITDFTQLGREVYMASVSGVSGGSGGIWTSINLASVVPANAQVAFGNALNSTTGDNVQIASDVNGIGQIGIQQNGFWRVAMRTAQTIYYGVAAGTATVNISGYTI